MAKKQIGKVSNRHRVLMRLLLTGLNHGDAAALLNYSPNQVTIVANSPLFKVEMEKMRGEIEGKFVKEEGDIGSKVRGVLEREGVNSAEKLVELRDEAENERVQLEAARDILDRLGIKGKDVFEVQERVIGSASLESMLSTAIKEMKGG